MLSTNRGFPNLDVTIGSDELAGPVRVTAQRGYHSDRHACLVADPGWRVTVDGVPLVLKSPGGAAAPTEISGVKLQLFNLPHRRLRLTPGREAPLHAPSARS